MEKIDMTERFKTKDLSDCLDKTYKIKPVEWEEYPATEEDEWMLSARSPYSMFISENDELMFASKDNTYKYRVQPDGPGRGFNTLEEAKLWAESMCYLEAMSYLIEQ